MNHDLKVGKLFGIEIDLHYSWFLIVVLLAWGLASEFFPAKYPDFSVFQYWVIGVVSALLLFVSVLIHELSHSLVAKKHGIAVEKITLFFFGGVASIGGEHITAKKEFLMAVAGPLVSLFLAWFFFMVSLFFSNIFVVAVSSYLATLNLVLGVFNLAPGFPLDGGRVLRAVLWHFWGDVKRATYWAAQSGKVVAGILIVVGFVGMLLGQGTLWFVLIGFFLYFLAGVSYDQIIIKDVLVKVKVKDVMLKKFVSISPSLSVASLFQKILDSGQESFLVVKDDKLFGFVSSDSLKKVPKKDWGKTKVKSVLFPLKISIKPSENAFHALSVLSKAKLPVLPVVSGKKFVGVVDSFSLIRYVRLNS